MHIERTRSSTGMWAVAAWVALGCSGGSQDRGLPEPDFMLKGSYVRVGNIDTVPGHGLYRVRAAAWEEPKRRLVIADAGSSEIRAFNAAGDLERTWGRTGSGPGEFLAIAGMWLTGDDTVITYDAGLQKLSFNLGSSGQLTREYRLPTDMAQVWGRLTGSLFLRASIQRPRLGQLRDMQSDSVVLGIIDIDNDSTRTLGRFSWRTMYLVRNPQGVVMNTPLPLHPANIFAIGAGHVYIASATTGTVKSLGVTGELADVVTVEEQGALIRPDIWDALAREFASGFPAPQRKQAREFYVSLPQPDRMPVVDKMVVAESGEIWLRHFPNPGRTEADWVVYSPTGARMGVCQIPTETTLLQVGHDFLVTLSKLPDDRETVDVFRLERS